MTTNLVAFAVDGTKASVDVRDDVAHVVIEDAAGKLLVHRPLNLRQTDNYGYEGCSVVHLDWCDKRVVLVTLEVDHVLWSVGTDGSAEHIVTVRRPLFVDDVALWPHRDDIGLVAVWDVAAWQPREPLPTNDESRHVELARDGDDVITRSGWLAPLKPKRGELLHGGELARVVTERIFEGRPLLARSLAEVLLVESALQPFTTLSTVRSSLPSVAWLVAYWHHHVRGLGDVASANDIIAALDAMAIARADGGASPQVAFISRYVRRRAALNANVCRTGELPRGWWCMLFRSPDRERVAETLPGRSRAALLQLAMFNPPEFKHSH